MGTKTNQGQDICTSRYEILIRSIPGLAGPRAFDGGPGRSNFGALGNLLGNGYEGASLAALTKAIGYQTARGPLRAAFVQTRRALSAKAVDRYRSAGGGLRFRGRSKQADRRAKFVEGALLDGIVALDQAAEPGGIA